MTPGTRITSDSPMGNDIKRIIHEMLKEELSLMVRQNLDDTVTLQLMLYGELLGKQFKLDVNWKVDHGHGGGSYVTGLEVKVIE